MAALYLRILTGLIYDKLLHMHGVEKARKYWEANEAAIGESA